MYKYSALVTKVYDGDTVTVDIDLGFGVVLSSETIRLYGINAPEVRGKSKEDGIASRDWLREAILNETVTLETIKPARKKKDKKGKYGRYLGVIYFQARNINEFIVEEGMAEFRVY